MPASSGETLTRALNATGRLITAIREDQWSTPTPCADWTVRDVVDHLVVGNLIVAALLVGQAPPDRDTDYLGDDAVAAYHHAATAVRAAFDHPGALERTYPGPFGPTPGSALLDRRIADTLVHGWDLAQAAGQGARLPDDLAEHAVVFSRTQLNNADRSSWFSAAQHVAEDAPAIDRLVASLGRRVPPANKTHGR